MGNADTLVPFISTAPPEVTSLQHERAVREIDQEVDIRLAFLQALSNVARALDEGRLSYNDLDMQ